MIDAVWHRRDGPRRVLLGAVRRAAARLGEAYDRLPLFWGVLLINASILVVAVLLLAVTPLTVSFPIATGQALILAGGLVLMVVANALLLRGGLKPLFVVLHALEEVELLARRHTLPVVGSIEVKTVTRAVNAALDRLEEERRSSSRRVLAALEGERRRVGQELHDEIGQRLTGILLELNPAIAAAPEGLRPRLVQIQEDARATLEEVGQLAWQLRPSVLDDLGLVAALDSLLAGIDEHADVELRRSLPASDPALEPEVEIAVFRIAQEAVTNAVRHADATRIEVLLEAEDGISLHVSDNGCGLPPHAQQGPGIQGMRERALLVDGDLRIDSPGELGGVTVVLAVPRREEG